MRITHAGIDVTILLCVAQEPITEEPIIANALVRQRLFDVLASSVSAAIIQSVTPDDFLSALCDAIADEADFARTVERLVFFVVETFGVVDASTTSAATVHLDAVVLGVALETWKITKRRLVSSTIAFIGEASLLQSHQVRVNSLV